MNHHSERWSTGSNGGTFELTYLGHISVQLCPFFIGLLCYGSEWLQMNMPSLVNEVDDPLGLHLMVELHVNVTSNNLL